MDLPTQVLQALKRDDGTYAKEALDQALKLRSELTPALLEILQRAVQDPNCELEGDSLAYASLLLSSWEEERAFPYFLQACELDSDRLDALFGDMLTENFPAFLFRTGKAQTAALKKLIENPNADNYARSAALEALNWLVASGLITREEMLRYHAQLFTNPANQSDPEWLTLILAEWMRLHPQAYRETIHAAFLREQVDDIFVGEWPVVEEQLINGSWEQSLAELKKEMDRRMPENIHDSTRWWSVEPPDLSPLDSELTDTLLARMMRDRGVEMKYHELRAYLLGIIWGVEHVPPSHVMSELLLLSSGEEVKFESAAEFQSFFSLVIELWNDLVDWPIADSTPILEPAPRFDDPETSAYFEALLLFQRRNEAEYFLLGLEETETYAEDLDDPRARSALEWVEDYFQKMDVLSQRVWKHHPEISEKHSQEIRALLEEGDKTWGHVALVLHDGLSELRLRSQEAREIIDSLQREAPKTGRNDLCPCGSGKKYKKCCL